MSSTLTSTAVPTATEKQMRPFVFVVAFWNPALSTMLHSTATAFRPTPSSRISRVSLTGSAQAALGITGLTLAGGVEPAVQKKHEDFKQFYPSDGVNFVIIIDL
jgi:hypothetical protein